MNFLCKTAHQTPSLIHTAILRAILNKNLHFNTIHHRSLGCICTATAVHLWSNKLQQETNTKNGTYWNLVTYASHSFITWAKQPTSIIYTTILSPYLDHRINNWLKSKQTNFRDNWSSDIEESWTEFQKRWSKVRKNVPEKASEKMFDVCGKSHRRYSDDLP
jgi:hypothetical protein